MEDSVLVKWAHNLLVQVGIEPETAHLLDQFVIIAMILLCALAADVICRFVILAVGRRIIVRTKKRWGELLFNRDVLRKFSNIVPVALIYILIPLAFPEHSETPVLLRKICLLYVIFVVVMFVNMLLKVFFGILEQKETLHDRPLKGLLQILQVGLFFLAAIVVTSLLIGRSPLKLLAGLGASAAILMLIFKDTIMGFVAGVMLSANKMLRPGDWISMPKYNVDGTVLEVTLNTVKIQNFDNTVTTVPPFILTGDSFQNWRWMQERIRAAGRPVEEVTVGGGDVVEQLERSSAADFGLRGELPYIDAVIAAVNDEANLVEKEHKIDLIRWNEAVELATFDYFDINSILSYLSRVNIVARWTQLDAVRGREMFERLMAELDGKGLIENKQ